MLASLVGCGGEAAPPDEPRPSILLVVCDTLRPDALGSYGAERATPALDGLAADGVRFDQARSSSPWTLPSFGTLLTGTPPSAHGARRRGANDFSGVSRDLATVPERLAAAGYRTAAVVTNPYLRRTFGLARGFDVYDYARPPKGRKVRADAQIDRALEHLGADVEAPLFLLVHLFDPHMGYDPPRELVDAEHALGEQELKRFHRRLWEKDRAPSDEDRELARALYDAEVRFADGELGRLLEALDDDPREWLVVFTSDHGEELWDHGGFEHGHTMYDELVRVPLVVRWPAGTSGGAHAGTTSDAAVNHLDVAATLLAAAGEPPLSARFGRDLRDVLAGTADARPVVCEASLYGEERRALVDGAYKLIENLESGSAELYDLESDPAERVDLAADEPERVAAMRAELASLVESAKALGARGTEVELDAETRGDLEHLGYVDDE